MKKRMVALISLGVLLSLGGFCAMTNTLTTAEKTAGWRLLFDGKTLDGWQITGSADGWRVENGEILNLAKGGGYLATKEQFGDFILSLDVKYEKGANSGVFFRWADLGDPVQTGIEMQILDSNGVKTPGKHDFGAIYDCLAPRKNTCRPAGEWNTVVLTCRKNRVWVDVNNARVLWMDLDKWDTAHKNPDGSDNKFRMAYKDMPRTGYIGIQDHGAKVWLRNVKIRPLNCP